VARATKRSPRMRALVVGSVLALTAGGGGGQSEQALQLTYLANMGVLLEVGDRRVVIDGLHRAELEGTPAVPPLHLAALEGATGAFRRIDVALTTHRHLDHFAAASVAARLRADSAVHYLAPREVVDTLWARGAAPSFAARVHPITPTPKGRVHYALAGVRIAALDLPHNPTRTPRAQNVGYLIRVGGVTILHVGDADPDGARFAPHRLAAERIDVAVLPSWYVTEASEMVRREIAPRTVVVSHVWVADTARVRRDVERLWPGAIVLTRPGETFRIRR
jgi:L-ascorbate metabolism protein UlaG (beta-lactamase superfamily)